MTNIEDRLQSIGEAGAVVDQCFQRAVSIIDGSMGPDYARKNPALLAAIVTNITHERQSALRDEALGDISDSIREVGQ